MPNRTDRELWLSHLHRCGRTAFFAGRTTQQLITLMSDYAKGLEGVIANESTLSRVEGLDGRLSYLGYNIDDLVEHCCYEEVVYLLHRGKLPNQSELDGLRK